MLEQVRVRVRLPSGPTSASGTLALSYINFKEIEI